MRTLREKTGKSQREFAALLGVDHSTVSVYEKPDGRVPDLAYIDGFLAEVRVTLEVRENTRAMYGRLLELLSGPSDQRGRSNTYKQMLRVYELTLEREEPTAELTKIHQVQPQVADELDQLKQQVGPAADPDRQQLLEEAAVNLEERSADLVRRQDAVVSDLAVYLVQLGQSQVPAR